MSLSRWLRDYLYIPLGGNRHGRLMTYRNLMLTMLLGGLWHGASWNFVIWGGYHGALLSAERIAGRERFLQTPGAWLYPFRAIFTFGLVCVGWVFFRAATLHESVYIVSQMFSGRGDNLIPVWLLCWTALSLLLALAEEKWEWMERFARGPAWAYATAVILLLLSVELIGAADRRPFVYFQF
jgi:D-alanyl-lipoteichoic acid acyltransferase DltB (MBOAT superfamily)